MRKRRLLRRVGYSSESMKMFRFLRRKNQSDTPWSEGEKLLGVFGLFLVFSLRVCGWVGGDRWLLPALGLPWKPGNGFQPQPSLLQQR